MGKIVKWLDKSKDYNILIIGILFFVIGYLINASLFINYVEYKQYLQLSTFYKIVYNMRQIIIVSIKLVSFMIGGIFMGVYLGRKFLRGA